MDQSLRIRSQAAGPRCRPGCICGTHEREYTDTADINLVIGSAATNVSEDLDDRFDRHLDWKGCLIHP